MSCLLILTLGEFSSFFASLALCLQSTNLAFLRFLEIISQACCFTYRNNISVIVSGGLPLWNWMVEQEVLRTKLFFTSCWVTALIFVYLPVTYCIMSKLFVTGTLLTIHGRIFTDQVMETEDFDPNMPTIERYITGRVWKYLEVWSHFIFSSQFSPAFDKCLRNTDNFCVNFTIFNGCKAQNSTLENIEEQTSPYYSTFP